MQEVQYIGETLWPGVLGHLAVLTAFVASLAGAIAFLKSARSGNQDWTRLGRQFFVVHGVAVITIIGLLFFMMIRQFYEYAYVWEHVSADLPMRYLLSAFWEGQEGSFLLWMFWHVVLGFIVMRKGGEWQGPVLGVLLLIQCILASMLLGIYVTDSFKVGSSPFMLLRDTMQAPIFARADYLSMIKGNGLNPLLQNYWMTIHPPTLFLGFASVAIPFCYAMGGLITQKHREWLRPVLPWALFSGGILGTGILMGGAWAYEALSFGGYWAWDPVENMSLVPWIILIAGIHSNLIARNTGHSLRAVYVFYALAFVLVLYSSFLTRSGVLGDTSAHAFTQMGLEWQLVLLVAFFTLTSAYYILRRWKSIPVPEKEEKVQSREFWMFIGTLVLLFSAVLISFTTSIPVYNKILNVAGQIAGTDFSHLHRTSPIDPVPHYNKFQLWIAVFVALLSGVAQYLRYKEPSWKNYRGRFLKHLAVAALLTAGLTTLLGLWIEAYAWQYIVLMTCAAFAVVANIDYLITFARLRARQAASGLAHLGFGVMLIGIMASGLNKSILSTNPFAQIGLIEGMDTQTHVTLIKNRPMFMNGYWVEYEKDSIVGNERRFLVSYKRIDENQDTIERFELMPNVVFNTEQTKVAASNPATKRYLARDIFTYVAALPGEQMDVEEARKINDTLDFRPFDLRVGEEVKTEKFRARLLSISPDPTHPEYRPLPGDLALMVEVAVENFEREVTDTVAALIYLRDGLVYGYPAQLNDLNTRIRLSDAAIRNYYTPDDSLRYESFTLKQGESTTWEDLTLTLISIDRAAAHPQYEPKEGDIAVNAVVSIASPAGQFEARPLYYIRDSRPSNIKTFIPEIGLHLRFERIDPTSETFYFKVADDGKKDRPLPIEIAQNVPRNDIIVLEAIVFPGINLFWLGSVLMMLGLFVGMWSKWRKRA